jgi:AcrR family transcriptional regulator
MTTQVPTRKERDRQLREVDFLSAAEHLFSHKGYSETSMEDVAREAEYATGTIYRYFASKEALFHQLLLRKGRSYHQAMIGNLRDDSAPLDKLHALIRSKVHFFFANREFIRIYFQNVAHPNPGDRCQPPAELMELHEEYLGLIHQVLSEGMKKRVIRNLDVDMALGALIGMTNELLMRFVDGEVSATEDALVKFLSEFIRDGLLTAKGAQ